MVKLLTDSCRSRDFPLSECLCVYTCAKQGKLEILYCCVVCALQVLDLISSDNLNVPSEEEVYRAVLSWVKHDIDGRRQHVPRVSVFLLVKNTVYVYSTL